MQRETNYPHISSCAVKRKPCAPVAVRNQLSWITYLLEIHSYICHRIPDVDSLNMLTPPHLWGGWTWLTPAGFIQDASWLVSAWRMGERASGGVLLLPLRCFPPEHLHCKQEQTPSSSSEWRDNSLLLSASAKGDGYLALMKIKDRIKSYRTQKKHQIYPVCSATWSYCGYPFLTMLNVFTTAIPTFRSGRVAGGRLGRWILCSVLPVFQRILVHLSILKST